MLMSSSLGLRDAILLVAGVAAVYFVFMLLRLMQIRRKNLLTAKPSSLTIGMGGNAGDLGTGKGLGNMPDPKQIHDDPVWSTETNTVGDEPQLAPFAPKSEEAFSDQFKRFALEGEYAQMQRDLTNLKGEMQELRDEVERLKAAQNVSPLYSEAVHLAQQGHDAAGIAGRCGISIAEAELVAALSRSSAEFADLNDEIGVEHGPVEARAVTRRAA